MPGLGGGAWSRGSAPVLLVSGGLLLPDAAALLQPVADPSSPTRAEGAAGAGHDRRSGGASLRCMTGPPAIVYVPGGAFADGGSFIETAPCLSAAPAATAGPWSASALAAWPVGGEGWAVGTLRTAVGCFGQRLRGAARPPRVVGRGGDHCERTDRPGGAGRGRGPSAMAARGGPNLLLEPGSRPDAAVDLTRRAKATPASWEARDSGRGRGDDRRVRPCAGRRLGAPG